MFAMGHPEAVILPLHNEGCVICVVVLAKKGRRAVKSIGDSTSA